MNEKLRETMAEVLVVPLDEIGPDTSPATRPEWDSLRHMMMIFAIEEAFGFKFDDAELPTLCSLGEIEKIVEMHLAGSGADE